MQIKLLENLCGEISPEIKKTFIQEMNEGKHAFIDIALDPELASRTNQAAQDLKKFKKIIVLGIGGSALGGISIMRSLYRPLRHMEKDAAHFFFLDQTDPDLIYHLTHNINFKETHFITISKSGGTIETASLYKYFRGQVEKAGLEVKNHFTFITGKTGYLAEEAEKEGYKTLLLPENISGRFSVLSEVGLLPAAIAGIDIEEILKGAKNALESFQSEEKSAPLVLAQNQYDLDNSGKPITVIFPYSYRLNRFADWYIQLMAESLGKNRETGPTPICAIGPTDQHAQLQLFMEGPLNKQVLFLEVEKHHHAPQVPGEKYTLEDLINAEKRGTQQALEDAGIPTQTIKIPHINEQTIGELIMTLELQIALLGNMYGISTYNQPGVEAGKVITKKLLSER